MTSEGKHYGSVLVEKHSSNISSRYPVLATTILIYVRWACLLGVHPGTATSSGGAGTRYGVDFAYSCVHSCTAVQLVAIPGTSTLLHALLDVSSVPNY